MDLCLTKDGEVVVIHDHNLDRLCGVNGSVHSFNYNDLPKFSDKVFLHFSQKKYFCPNNSKETFIPRFEVKLFFL